MLAAWQLLQQGSNTGAVALYRYTAMPKGFSPQLPSSLLIPAALLCCSPLWSFTQSFPLQLSEVMALGRPSSGLGLKVIMLFGI